MPVCNALRYGLPPKRQFLADNSKYYVCMLVKGSTFSSIFGVFRPNLYLTVSKKGGDVARDLRSQMVLSGSNLTFEGPTIIYCPTKKSAEETENVVRGNTKKCLGM